MKKRYKAILFDVDGTLYRQKPLRQRIIKELLLTCLRNPFSGYQLIRIIYTFRKERERLRQKIGTDPIFLEEAQYSLPAQKLGVSENSVRHVVREWIYKRSLKYLKLYKISGLDEFLELCRAKGIKTGVFSDYPAQEKLKALGVAHLIDLVLCATDPEINAFKPSPRGLEVALEKLGLSPEKVLYIGDRLDVDGKCAETLNMSFCLITTHPKRECQIPQFQDYEELRKFIF